MLKFSHIHRQTILGVIALIVTAGCGRPDPISASKLGAMLEEGDLVFIWNLHDRYAVATGKLMDTKFNHVGVVLRDRASRDWRILEVHHAVQFIPLDQFLEKARGGRCVVKRLHDREALNLEAMRAVAERFQGSRYDHKMYWETDFRLYAGELAAKLFLAGGVKLFDRFRTMGEYDWMAKEQELRPTLGFINVNRRVMLPDQLFESDLLKTVVSTL